MATIRHNLGYKLLALALSILLWADVKLHQEPLTIPYLVQIKTRNVPPGYVATTAVTQATAVIYGPKVYTTRIPSTSLDAYVDLHGSSTPLERKEDVKVELPPRLRSVVSLQSVAPDKVDVRIRRTTSKSVPVTINWSGQFLPGARYEVSLVEPNRVLVTGPDEAVNDVDHAVVTLTTGAQHVVGSFAASPVDRRGEPVNEVRMEPDAVNVDATLRQTEGTRQVLVTPSLVGTPAKGFHIDRVITEPQVVVLIGPPNLIGDVNSVRTQRLDVANARSDVVRNVTIAAPNGVVAQPATVLVRLRIRPGE